MYSKTGGDSKEPRKSTGSGKRNILNMLENSWKSNSKPCNKGSSSSDSSDCEDEPVVKRPRKTVRRVIDPSKLPSSIYGPANVYTTVVKKAFEEINSFNFSKYCQEETEKIKKEVQKPKELKETSPSELDDDLVIIENESSTQEVVYLCNQSPPPPSPPPPVTTRPLRSRSYINQDLNNIQSSLKNIDNALNSGTCDTQSLDDSLIIMEDTNVQEEDLDTSLDNFNRQIVVLVKIGSQIIRFPMNKTDTFCNLFSFLAKEKEVSDTRLMLVLNEKTIHQNETPASIQLHVADIIDCLITVEDYNEEFSERTGPNVISLVIQSSLNQKSKTTMRIGKFEKLQGIIDIYAKQNKLQAANLKLRFDGEIVDTSQTPADLDMEDEDCIDLLMA